MNEGELIQTLEEFLASGGESLVDEEQDVRFTVRHGVTRFSVEDRDILYEWRWVAQEDIDDAE